MCVARSSMCNMCCTISAMALLRLRPDVANDEHGSQKSGQTLSVLIEEKRNGIKPQCNNFAL